MKSKKTRISAFLLALTLLVTMFVPSMSASAASPVYCSRAREGTYVVVNMSEYSCGVSVRSTASYDYASIATINANTAYKFVSETTDKYGKPWFKINYTSSKTGWVCGFYTRKVTVKSNNYVMSPSTTINMRKGPSTGFTSLGKTRTNTYYSIIGCNSEDFSVTGTKWYQCMDNGMRVFWLKSTLLAKVKMCANVPCDVSDENYIANQFRFKAASNVRKGPSTSYAKVRSSSFGTGCIVYIYDITLNTASEIWYYVRVIEGSKSYYGYVLGTLLK